MKSFTMGIVTGGLMTAIGIGCLLQDQKYYQSIKKKGNKIMKKGFPLDSLSIDIKSGKYYYDLAEEELEQMDEEEGFVKFFEEIIKRGLIK